MSTTKLANKVEFSVVLAEEERQLITDLIAELRRSRLMVLPAESVPTEVAEPVKVETEKVEETPTPAKAEAPACGLADVQKKVVELSAAGKKDEVKAIIHGYAERVSAIPEEQLPEVMEKLMELEG